MRPGHTLAFVVLILSLAGCVTLDGFLGESETVSALREKAAAGDQNSQYRLGLRYTQGYGVREDYLEAARWFAKSAKQGHPDAAYMLGIALYTGRGVERDASYAVPWFTAAADNGHMRARYQLGDAFANGRGVKKEPAWALRWFESAARMGHGQAQFSAGVLYSGTEGVPRDDMRAWFWLTLAAQAEQPLAGDVRQRLAETLDRQAVEQAERAAMRFSALEQGQADSQATIAFAQSSLRLLGYDPGTADGLAGPETTSALARFRRDLGLTASGPLTPGDLDALREQIRTRL